MITSKHVALTHARQLARKWDEIVFIWIVPEDKFEVSYELYLESNAYLAGFWRDPDIAVFPDGTLEI